MKRNVSRDVLVAALGGVLLVGVFLVVDLIRGDSEVSPLATESTFPMPSNDATGTSVPTVVDSSTSTSASVTTSPTIPASATTMPFAGEGGMSISNIESTETDLWETANGECSSNPLTAVVSATMLAPSGISAAVLGWGVDAPEVELQWVEMLEAAPDVYSATIGPFPAGTLEPGSIEPILVAIEAGDPSGNAVLADPASLLLLHDCGSG